jgi:hypothetical protein
MAGPLTEASNDAEANFSPDPVGGVSISCPEPCRCDDKPTPIDPTQMCQSGCDYYVKREQDFRDRHSCPECKDAFPPDYYLNYGLKYCVRFSTETAPKLSPEGQAWLARARCNLQAAMEKGLQQQPDLELNSDGFRKFAFATHPDAYLNAGLSDLSVSDMAKIALTPDLKEWTSLDTWIQAGQVGVGVVGEDLSKAKEAVSKWFGDSDGTSGGGGSFGGGGSSDEW